jgi:hypothetical protein
LNEQVLSIGIRELSNALDQAHENPERVQQVIHGIESTIRIGQALDEYASTIKIKARKTKSRKAKRKIKRALLKLTTPVARALKSPPRRKFQLYLLLLLLPLHLKSKRLHRALEPFQRALNLLKV